MVPQINYWIKGDDGAFEPIFYHYHPRLYKYVLKCIKNRMVAEDLAMEILVTVWKRRDKITADTFERYLFTIARNRVIDEWRKTIDRLLSLDNAETTVLTEHYPLEYDELETAYRQCLSVLPDQRRTIFLMHREGNLSYREIAQRLNISPKTVENQMGAALKQLRQKLLLHLNSLFL